MALGSQGLPGLCLRDVQRSHGKTQVLIEPTCTLQDVGNRANWSKKPQTFKILEAYVKVSVKDVFFSDTCVNAIMVMHICIYNVYKHMYIYGT